MAKTVAACIGIVAAAVIGVVITANVRHYTPETIPTWLPPIPFAIVAVMLFVLGALVWLRGEKKDDAARGKPAGH